MTAFGFNGVLELLSSGALDIAWNPFSIATDFHQNGKRVLPPFHFDFGGVSIADPEEHIHSCLQHLHDITGLPHKRILRLKRELVSRLVNLPEGFDKNVLAQLKSDIRGSSPLIGSAVRAKLKRRFDTSKLPDFDLEFEEVPRVGFRAHTNLASKAGLSDADAHDILQSALAALAGLSQRTSEMSAYNALSGFNNEDSEIFAEKCNFLIQQVSPSTIEKSFTRVLEVTGFPDVAFDGQHAAVNMTKLLRVRDRDECKDFRDWLLSAQDFSEAAT